MCSRGSYILCFLVSLTLLSASVLAAKKSTRIVGGSVITIDQTPYLVQLRNAAGGVICGGTLVRPQHVVTAGHCVQNLKSEDVLVVGGVSTMSEKSVEYEVESITIHPEYDPKTMHSDVAVLKLARSMSGENIKPIGLAKTPVEEGDMIQVSGWGLTVQAEGSLMSEQLRTVRFPVASEEACSNEFHQFVEKNMFCASGLEAKSFCMGDSGGPGISKGRLAGVVSFLGKCGSVGHRSVFTDVYATRSFIRRALKK